NLALLPHARNVGLPRLAHATDKSVRAAQEKNVGAERMTAGKYAEILKHDGLEERRHQLIRRRACLLQSVDVSLGKNPTFAGNLVQLDALVPLIRELRGGDLELGINLVDDRSCATGAFVVHRGEFLLASSLLIVFEDDDLRILPA